MSNDGKTEVDQTALLYHSRRADVEVDEAAPDTWPEALEGPPPKLDPSTDVQAAHIGIERSNLGILNVRPLITMTKTHVEGELLTWIHSNDHIRSLVIVVKAPFKPR